jgi:hypothetical protein
MGSPADRSVVGPPLPSVRRTLSPVVTRTWAWCSSLDEGEAMVGDEFVECSGDGVADAAVGDESAELLDAEPSEGQAGADRGVAERFAVVTLAGA